MDKIIINLNDLYDVVRRMRRDDMSYVELQLCPAEVIDGELCPASLEISGIRSSNPDMAVDYDSIDASAISAPRSFMSRNML